MEIKEFIELFNVDYENLVLDNKMEFNDYFDSEKNKNWLVPIEQKLSFLKLNDQSFIAKVIELIKSTDDFTNDHIECKSPKKSNSLKLDINV